MSSPSSHCPWHMAAAQDHWLNEQQSTRPLHQDLVIAQEPKYPGFYPTGPLLSFTPSPTWILITLLTICINVLSLSILLLVLNGTLAKLLFLFFVLFFLFWPLHSMWQFLGQGSLPSRLCHLCRTCGSTRCFNPRCWVRNWTCILALQRHCQSHCTTAGTPNLFFLDKCFLTLMMPFKPEVTCLFYSSILRTNEDMKYFSWRIKFLKGRVRIFKFNNNAFYLFHWIIAIINSSQIWLL